MASWTSLPPEVRRMVFQAAISRSPSLAAPVLATVSREWQDFFERSTFKDLALTDGDLYTFASVIKRDANRLGYIRTLRLRINLMPYNGHIPLRSRLQGKFESATIIIQNNRIFTQAIAVLLKVLSLWRGDSGGLELELDVRSPSDYRHFQFIHELHDDFLFRFQDEDELFKAVEKLYKKGTERQRKDRVYLHIYCPPCPQASRDSGIAEDQFVALGSTIVRYHSSLPEHVTGNHSGWKLRGVQTRETFYHVRPSSSDDASLTDHGALVLLPQLWVLIQNRPSFILEDEVVREWEKVASPRLLTVNSAPFDYPGGKWKRSMIFPYLHLRRLAYSPLEEAQVRAFQIGNRNYWYAPLTQDYRGVY
ncbi:hypothetical protein F52700_9330 [Fusarium sp. NRRL 52700]|nr:hypothetical protein F52700_9330 [Fusarium sp. NRRL 52700]